MVLWGDWVGRAGLALLLLLSVFLESQETIDAARVEIDAFERAITDWERVRGFERL